MADSTLRIFDRDIPNPFKRELIVAPDDELSARAINRWRASGALPEDLPVSTSEYMPKGYGFFADGRGSGQILQFEERAEQPR